MPNARKIYVMRHAKAVRDGSMEDHDRPINAQGKSACLQMGRYMKKLAIKPSLVLCSTATRTRETVKNILPNLNPSLPVEYVAKLYLATAGEIFDVLKTVDDNDRAVLIVGHNPGIHQFCQMLTAGGAPEALVLMNAGMPTAAFASFTTNLESWADVGPACATLEAFAMPGGFEE